MQQLEWRLHKLPHYTVQNWHIIGRVTNLTSHRLGTHTHTHLDVYVYVRGGMTPEVSPWFISWQKVEVWGDLLDPFELLLLQPPQPFLTALFSTNVCSEQCHFSSKQHLSVQSSYAQAKCVCVCVCVCVSLCPCVELCVYQLLSRAPVSHLSEAATPREIMRLPFPPSCPPGPQRCEWILVFISFNTRALCGGTIMKRGDKEK